MNEEWSFEREDAESWEQDFFDTKKEAIEAGREWAKKEGLDWFCVGRGENVQISTKLEIEEIFNILDDQYYYDCGNPDVDCAPFDESCRKENEAARERLEEKISKALKEYVEEAGVTGRRCWIEDVCVCSIYV